MDILIITGIFAGIWLITTLTFVVLYKKKQSSGSTDEKSIKQMLDNQKEQNLMLNNMIMQALKNSEVGTQNNINNLTVMQKQELESIAKRVDILTTRNEQRIEKLTLDVNNSLNHIREENDKAIEKCAKQLMKN